MKILFKEIEYKSLDWKNCVKLRENVLRRPLGSFFTAQELEVEKSHFHVAGFLNGALIATAVLVPEGTTFKMQRVAVIEQYRNQNIGSLMMAFCENLSSSKKGSSIYCHARDTAVNFYIKNGYTSVGDYFDEDGIPHLKMRKEIKCF